MKMPNKQISQVYSKSDSDSEEDALSEDALSEDSLSDSLSLSSDSMSCWFDTFVFNVSQCFCVYI